MVTGTGYKRKILFCGRHPTPIPPTFSLAFCPWFVLKEINKRIGMMFLKGLTKQIMVPLWLR